ncbi:IS21-like element helper ATPase IstB [Alicyclobacillus sendaiensis]|uniref:IS21-like element helper ATPase IstB n=1 Tax=Alicyclobacillus sendaiensis PA2 TaxID=3029425 RepID=A0ABT6XZN4_ALISE|nr:IS21-like element helper ATPase IstB [Alicyclobacillus sendaiensis]MDI9260532.1 IS21-like element helper ATPase IstB [Alicyclobacillus sendaiensis PA2]
MLQLDKVRDQLERLKLSTAASHLETRLRAAMHRQATYLDFLEDLLEGELRIREERHLQLRLRMARLPYRKTLEDFDFTFQPSLDEKAIRELATMSFVERAENVLFLGPPEVGKTHLAVALGLEALRAGYSVYFSPLARLVEDLRRAYDERRLNVRMRPYLRPKLLIVDEVGYTKLDPVAANVFFQLVNARYERGSLILTSNKSFGEWGELLGGDVVLATAVLDRLLHHAHIVNIRGQSYRLREKVRAGVYATPRVDEERHNT